MNEVADDVSPIRQGLLRDGTLCLPCQTRRPPSSNTSEQDSGPNPASPWSWGRPAPLPTFRSCPYKADVHGQCFRRALRVPFSDSGSSQMSVIVTPSLFGWDSKGELTTRANDPSLEGVGSSLDTQLKEPGIGSLMCSLIHSTNMHGW